MTAAPATTDLENSDIADLTPLASLTGLLTVSISHAAISDLSPLAGLPQLDKLYLHGNVGITDLTPPADARRAGQSRAPT